MFIKRTGFFSNLFKSKDIIPLRMLTFTRFVIAMLTALGEAFFTDIITKLTASADALEAELGAVDENLTVQKNATAAVNDFAFSFGQFMKDNEAAIMVALGGKKSLAYKAFFPKNATEYTTATLGALPILVKRVANAVTKYGSQLPTTLAAQLTAFAPTYEGLASSAKQQRSAVNDDRISRTKVYGELQLQLTSAMHLVGAKYPGEEAFCQSKFPLHMLYAPARAKSIEAKGMLAAAASAVIMNRTLGTRTTITITNTGSNATLVAWICASADAARPLKIIEVLPGETKTVRAATLGDLKVNTFLMIANNSEANEASYYVEVVGIKREKKAKQTAAEKKKVKEAAKAEKTTLKIAS